jgi:hypothetical protein
VSGVVFWVVGSHLEHEKPLMGVVDKGLARVRQFDLVVLFSNSGMNLKSYRLTGLKVAV